MKACLRALLWLSALLACGLRFALGVAAFITDDAKLFTTAMHQTFEACSLELNQVCNAVYSVFTFEGGAPDALAAERLGAASTGAVLVFSGGELGIAYGETLAAHHAAFAQTRQAFAESMATGNYSQAVSDAYFSVFDILCSANGLLPSGFSPYPAERISPARPQSVFSRFLWPAILLGAIFFCAVRFGSPARKKGAKRKRPLIFPFAPRTRSEYPPEDYRNSAAYRRRHPK